MKGFENGSSRLSRRSLCRWLLWGVTVIAPSSPAVSAAKAPRFESAKDFLVFFDAEVPIGASRAKVEEFLKQHEISFSWNPYYKRTDKKPGRYHAIIRNVSPFHSISIRIYLNDNNTLEYCEAFDSYTSL